MYAWAFEKALNEAHDCMGISIFSTFEHDGNFPRL